MITDCLITVKNRSVYSEADRGHFTLRNTSIFYVSRYLEIMEYRDHTCFFFLMHLHLPWLGVLRTRTGLGFKLLLRDTANVIDCNKHA